MTRFPLATDRPDESDGASETVAVITIVSGRHRHLRRQLQAFAHSTVRPRVHIVVAMDDPRIDAVVADSAPAGHPIRVLHVTGEDPGTLPLAAARATRARGPLSTTGPRSWCSWTSIASPARPWCSGTFDHVLRPQTCGCCTAAR